MKKFILAIMFMIMASCAATGYSSSARMVGKPTGDAINCATALTLIDVRPDDAPLMRSYTREACRVSDGANVLLGTTEVKVIAMPFDEVIANCSPEGGMALACTRKHPSRPGTYTIFIPHGSPGIMMHEILHIILWEQKIPGAMHHPIMKQNGWYWIDRYKGDKH